MAIDSADKRRSALQSCMPICSVLMPASDSSIDEDDRATVLKIYGGNAFAEAADASGTRRVRHIAALMKARIRRCHR